MPTIQHEIMREFGSAIFLAAGLPPEQCEVAINHLVDANLAGHDSHGVIRIPRYTRELLAGEIRPMGTHKVVRETPATMVIDANDSIGIVLCRSVMQWAVDRALKHTFGAVAVHNCGHIGRLGEFTPLAADQDCIGVLMLNGGSTFTAPFGGTGRRLSPNPISIAVPTAGETPMVLDMTASMAAGGKVALAAARGQELPGGWLVDRGGKSVTDPNRFSGQDPAAMLPLGGPAGHKGYGLAMMIDAIAGGLSWAGCSAEKPTRGGSGYLALAIRIDSFTDTDDYKKEIGILIDWVKSTPLMPGHDRVYYPGEIEAETRERLEIEGMEIEDATWNAVLNVAKELGVTPPKGI